MSRKADLITARYSGRAMIRSGQFNTEAGYELRSDSEWKNEPVG